MLWFISNNSNVFGYTLFEGFNIIITNIIYTTTDIAKVKISI